MGVSVCCHLLEKERSHCRDQGDAEWSADDDGEERCDEDFFPPVDVLLPFSLILWQHSIARFLGSHLQALKGVQ